MSASTFTLDSLLHAVQEDAAFRRIRRLQPVGGKGDKIFPPTYPGVRKDDPARHVFERRRIDGANVLCVLIDSVQSQANRLEEALRIVRDTKGLKFPVIAVDFQGTAVEDIGRISTLDAPHRVFDAIIRDSELDGTRFRETDAGKRLIQAKAQNAAAVFELSPTALIFGAWNSTGEGGGLGAKFPRAVVSEIVGVNVAVERDPHSHEEVPSGKRTGSRIDPLGIRSAVRVYKHPDGDWSLDAPKTEGKKGDKDAPKEVRPSEINHSNIAPDVQPLGVSIDHALHTYVISLASLRRLSISPGRDEKSRKENVAAHAVLAALGLVAATAQDRSGYALRSRCDLVPEEGSVASFETIGPEGQRTPFNLTLDQACEIAQAAIKNATSLHLPWAKEDLVLKPQKKLVELVRQSRAKALEGVADAAAE